MITKKLESVTQINTDVSIVGGGLAGVCAAIAAARHGSSVALIQSRPVLGGNSSSEIRVWTRGATGGGNLFAEEMGILGELKLANHYRNPEGNPILWDAVLLDYVLMEPNIRLYLNTFVSQVEASDGHIQAIHALEIISERKFTFSSTLCIDASGDGFVAASCGMEYMIGKEDRATYGEVNASTEFDPTTQGCTILMNTIKKDHPVPFIAPGFAYPLEYIENLLNNGGRIVCEKSNGSDFWWVEFGGQQDTINSIASIAFELKKLIFGIYNYIKNSGKFDAGNVDLSWVGSLPGKRESRRFKTDYVLTGNDVIARKHFDDVAFYGGWYLDFHPSEGIYGKTDFCTQIPVSLYGIPLRSLYSSSFDNVLLCGRIIGTTHVAFASTRIMDTCALSGQAAGTAASFLVSQGKKTQDLAEPSVFQAIQAMLEKDDVLLPGYGPAASAEEVTFIPSSVITSLPGKEIGSLPLDRDFFVALPVSLAKVSSLILHSDQMTDLLVEVRHSMLPSRNDYSVTKESFQESLPKGRTKLSLTPFCKGEGYLLLIVKPTSGVSGVICDHGLSGVLCGYADSAEYFNPLLDVRSFASYGSQNLNNGYTRPYGAANIWLSSQEEVPSIKILMPKKRTVSSLAFFFDCSLSEEMVSSRVQDVDPHHNIYLRSGVSPFLVRDFEIFAHVDGKEVLLKQVKNNFQRHVDVLVGPVATDSLSVRFLSTYGAKNIGVYEIRVH
ncbi:MAG: FAD-dependent oxidoreductase [Sphaerochaeta sp.]|nr:FAD-dependent oxidoreductase [Sphaerochaeta sp.]